MMKPAHPSDPLVVEAVRGDIVESMHLVDVAVTDAGGNPVASAGEPEAVAYLRSSAKPVQATACVELGWEPPGESGLAVACASHNGEEVHVEAVRAILAAAGLEERDLGCPPAAPSLVGAPPAPEVVGPIYHNCSGKHAAMLAATVAMGDDPERYLRRDTDLHRAIEARVEGLAGRPARTVGVDGCGVPTFAFALREGARLYAGLPAAAPDAVAAMKANPYLVAGSSRICTAVMSLTPNVVLKVGAEGLMCGALLGRGIGFALKARDGAARGREIATVRLLEMLDALGGDAPVRILEAIRPRLTSGQGRQPVLRCRGELQPA